MALSWMDKRKVYTDVVNKALTLKSLQGFTTVFHYFFTKEKIVNCFSDFFCNVTRSFSVTSFSNKHIPL